MFLYDIDDLQNIVDQNLAASEEIAKEIEEELNMEIDDFKEWVATLGVVPVIRALRRRH